MFLAKKLNKGSGTPAVLDAKFNYVTMLLHGNGTNGTQNNTFLDSSSNTRSITRTGTPTQGSFSPYGSNWSNFFDGSNASLTAPYIALSSNFTIEFWAFANVLGGSRGLVGISKVEDSRNIVVRADGTNLEFWVDGYNYITTATSVLSVGNWFHVALVRNGSTNTLYLNGTSVASSTRTPIQANNPITTIGRTYESFPTGELWNGYISNVRIGTTAVYTSAFTPSTTPLTAISGTVLLTCQSNRFIDNSTNAYTITAVGSPSVQRFNPFGTATAYSTSVIGGSGYFNTSNYLSVGTLGSASSGVPYCLEMWVYPTSFRGSGEMRLCGAGTNDPLLQFSGNTDLQYFVNNTFICGYSATFAPNQWYHIAITRSSGNTTTMYLNGVSVATGSNSFTLNTNTFLVGAQPTSPTIGLIGYMTDFRAVLGSVVYSSAFTPPTAPLTNITNTSLLCNFTNGAIFDNAMMNNLETVDTSISTSVVKYGTGSLSFNQSGNYLLSPPVASNALDSGNFTVECWAYIISLSAYRTLVCFGDYSASSGAIMYISATGQLRFFNSGFTEVVSSTTISTDTWYHFAVTRSSGTVRVFINGTLEGSGTMTNNISATQIRVGRGIYLGILDTDAMYGYIDDLRITKGYARYTANFTPPTAAFLDIGPN